MLYLSSSSSWSQGGGLVEIRHFLMVDYSTQQVAFVTEVCLLLAAQIVSWQTHTFEDMLAGNHLVCLFVLLL